jgi:hypothetical protein
VDVAHAPTDDELLNRGFEGAIFQIGAARSEKEMAERFEAIAGCPTFEDSLSIVRCVSTTRQVHPTLIRWRSGQASDWQPLANLPAAQPGISFTFALDEHLRTKRGNRDKGLGPGDGFERLKDKFR